MKKQFDIILKRAISTKDVSYFGKWVPYLVNRFGVSEKTVYNRFKSYYRVSPRDYIRNRVYPTKKQMMSFIISSFSSEEVREKTGLSGRCFNGIYDKFFGVSTFQKAKIKCLSSGYKLVAISPNREDNRSIIYSQLLGDGSYEERRHAMRITHGIKQAEYLKFKADLIAEAYPRLKKDVKIHTHSQGHQYVRWYSGKLGNIDIPGKETYHLLVEKLTPLGWLLWFLDDGNYSQNFSICTTNEKLGAAAVSQLKTYGISSTYRNPIVVMCGQEQDLLFAQSFIFPFLKIIPNCMFYKIEDIVEMSGINLPEHRK